MNPKLRKVLGPTDVGAIACIRGGVIVNIIRSTLEFAQTLGFDIVGEAVPNGAGFTVNGVNYAAPVTETPESIAARQAALQAIANIQAYADLPTPNLAQTVAQVRLLGRVCTRLLRWRYGDTEE